MRAVNTSRVVPLWNYSIPLGNSSLNNHTMERLIVSSDVIRKGNFKSPQPWSYDVSHTLCDENRDMYVRADGTGADQHLTSFSVGAVPGRVWSQTEASALEDNTAKLYELLRGSLDLSIDAFQARQTAKMFHVASQLEDIFLRRASAIRKVGSLWLQYVYGWRPLASTIYGIAEESRRVVCARVRTIDVRSHVRFEESESINRNFPTGVVRVPYQYKGGVVVKRRASYTIPGLDLGRWTSLNPLSIAWELMPYSFVIDWVVNVGGFLRTLESASLYAKNFTGGFQSILRYQDTKWSVVSTKHNASYKTLLTTCSGTKKDRSFSRTLLTSTPFPKPPKLQLQLGSGRLLNAAALLSQRLR